MKPYLFLPVAAVIFLAACSSQNKSLSKPVHGLTFLSEHTLPYKLQFGGTTVGGLSGIDYDAAEDAYYLICDDRSELAPARFYKARMAITNNAIDSVSLLSVTYLRQPNDSLYPNRLRDIHHTPDPEALRVNTTNGTMVWTSEGERIVFNTGSVLVNPSIDIISKAGKYIDSFPLPDNLRMQVKEAGPRQNGVFEGISFANNNKTLYVSVEEPLYEDGPRAGLQDSTAWIRILQYDVATKLLVAQYAYPIDAVINAPVPAGAFKINGVPDILALNNHQLLVTERSFSTGRPGCNIRVYLAELNGAANIKEVVSIPQHLPIKPVQKKLLLNMDSLHRYIDNVEGATFGPRLPDGKRSLVFVTDDNFAAGQKTQFLLFQVD